MNNNNNILLLDLDVSISSSSSRAGDGLILFDDNIVKKTSMSILRNIKNEKVNIIGITSRGLEDLKKIDKGLLSILSKIYYLNGFACYDVTTSSICEAYNKNFTINYLSTVEVNKAILRDIISQLNIPTEAVKYTTSDKVTVSIDLNILDLGLIESLMDRVCLEDFNYILDNKYNKLEIWLFNSNRSAVGQHELSINGDANIVTLGGTVDDLPLIKYSELCILPKNIIETTLRQNSFMYISTIVSKIKGIDYTSKSSLVTNGLNAVLSTYQKFNKNRIA